MVEEKPTSLQEARTQLEALLPEVHRTLNNWSLEPTWTRAAPRRAVLLPGVRHRDPRARCLHRLAPPLFLTGFLRRHRGGSVPQLEEVRQRMRAEQAGDEAGEGRAEHEAIGQEGGD